MLDPVVERLLHHSFPLLLGDNDRGCAAATFEGAGFRVREVLSDLKSGYSTNADFFTLVLEK